MKMTREELVDKNKMERPYWSTEEFIATRILRTINASGAKAYEHLKIAISQMLPECSTRGRWDIALFMLKRRISLNLVVHEPRIAGLPYAVLPKRMAQFDIAKYVCDAPFHNKGAGSLGPDFYIFRMPDDVCMIAYAVWNLDLLRDLQPGFGVYKGNWNERIVTQGLDTFLSMVEFKSIANELIL